MDLIKDLFGLDLEPREFSLTQILLRALVVFFSSLVLVRIANRRFLGKLSPLDVILGFVLASTLARAINGSGPLFESMAAGLLLVLLHRALAGLAYRSDLIEKLVKGEPRTLIENGKVKDRELAAHNISEKDLVEALRIGGKVQNPQEVAKAVLERDGHISVIKKE